MLKVAGDGVTLAIQDVELSQGQLISVSQFTQNPYFRLAPLKPTLVRVRLAPNPTREVYRPQVRLSVRNNTLRTRTFQMKGPATLGPDPVEEVDLGHSYLFELAPEWMAPGFELDVAVNEQRSPSNVEHFHYVPRAGVLRDGT